MLRNLRPARWPWHRPGSAPPPASHPGYTLVFLHIPKTAGLSLRAVLRARTDGLPRFRITDPIDDTRRLAALPRERRAAFGLVQGHLYYGIHEILARPCIYLTMLREPVERLLSYYSFVREWTPHHLHARIAGDNLSLAECLRLGLTIELDNFMVRALTSLRCAHVPFGGVTRSMLDEARAHLDSVAGLGLTEEFEASLEFFCSLFGWPRAEAPTINASAKRVRRETLASADLDLILEQNRLDVELYDYAQRLFRSRLGREAPVLAAPPAPPRSQP